MKKLKCISILIIFISIILCKSVYASFADFTDEDAEKQTQNMIQEHNKEFDSTKSDNNYLKELKITGGTLSPNFERQTLEYTFEAENKTNQINITATPEDSSAKVNGAGTIDILKISECKVEVIAESGTTRTYFIKFIKQNEETTEHNNESENEVIEGEIVENKQINTNTPNTQQDNLPKQDYKKYFIIGIGSILFILIMFIIIRKKNKKSKH